MRAESSIWDGARSRRSVLQAAAGVMAGLGGLALQAACGGGAAAPAGSATAAAGQPAPTSAAAAPTAAAGQAAATAAPAPAAGGVKGSVKFFARGDDAIFKVFDQINAAFSQQNPGITVTIDKVPGDFHQKLQLELASGTPPDAAFECDCTLGPDVQAGAVDAIDSYLSKEKVSADQFWPIAFYASTYAGKKWGMPYDGGSVVLYYNKDLFKAAGVPDLDPKVAAKWDDIVTMAQKLTLDFNGKHPGESGFDPAKIKQYGLDPSVGYWQVYIWTFGGEVITKEGQVPIDSPEATAGLQFLADLGAKHNVSPAPQFVQSSPVSFNTGNVAMVYDGVWGSVRYRQNKFAWDVAPFPQQKVQVSTGWYSPLSLMAQSKSKDAAWQWIYFCTSEPGQKIVSGLGQDVPTIQSLAKSDAFLNPSVPPDHKQVFLDQMDPSLLRVPGDKYGSYFGGQVTQFREIFNKAFDPVWRGQKSAADAAKAARPQLEDLLKQAKFPS